MDIHTLTFERLKFRDRLIASLVAEGHRISASSFVREFNARADGVEVTVHAARKWLVGDAIPTQERVGILARWLNVSPHWLRFGADYTNFAFCASSKALLLNFELHTLHDFALLNERDQAIVRDFVKLLLRQQLLGVEICRSRSP